MSEDRLPPVLADLGRQFDDLGEHDYRERRRRRQRRRQFGALPTAVVSAVLAAAVAAGATAVIDDGGPPIAPEDRPGVPVPPLDPSVVASTRTPDPDGGPAWILRVFTNDSGEECLVVGRIKDGIFGQLQRGDFRPLPAKTPGLCGDVAARGLVAFADRRSLPPRTAVFGLSAGRSEVRVGLGRQGRTVRPGGLGAFLAVFVSGARMDVATVASTIGARRVRVDLP